MMVGSYFLLFTTLRPPYLGVRLEFLSLSAGVWWLEEKSGALILGE